MRFSAPGPGLHGRQRVSREQARGAGNLARVCAGAPSGKVRYRGETEDRSAALIALARRHRWPTDAKEL